MYMVGPSLSSDHFFSAHSYQGILVLLGWSAIWCKLRVKKERNLDEKYVYSRVDVIICNQFEYLEYCNYRTRSIKETKWVERTPPPMGKLWRFSSSIHFIFNIFFLDEIGYTLNFNQINFKYFQKMTILRLSRDT